MKERFVFASPAWLAFMGEQLDALAAQHAGDLHGANYIMSQHYVGGPAEFGTTAWWFRATNGGLRWGIGALPREVCDCYVEAPYDAMVEAAMIDTSASPAEAAKLQALLAGLMERGEMIGFDAPERRPAFLFRMHDILAKVTCRPGDR